MHLTKFMSSQELLGDITVQYIVVLIRIWTNLSGCVQLVRKHLASIAPKADHPQVC
jgi:hypothetical protein